MHGYAELIEGWRDKCREVESERDALRAEVEVLKKEIQRLKYPRCTCPRCTGQPDYYAATPEDEAISEARKGEGEG